MFILYVDEFGHDGIWDPTDSKRDHHPLFGLAGLVIPGENARGFDRGYLRLKQQFFPWEMKQYHQAGKRFERFEPKRLKNKRDIRFAAAVLELVKKCRGSGFINGVEKSPGPAGYDANTAYNVHMKGILSGFERFLRHRGSKLAGVGLVVMDQRHVAKDEKVLSAAQFHLFSRTPSYTSAFSRIVETPLLVPSHFYHGVQAADTFARVVGKLFQFRLLGDTRHEQVERQLGQRVDDLSYAIRQQRGASDWTSFWFRRPKARMLAVVPSPPSPLPAALVPALLTDPTTLKQN
jgi:hypothetical protein